MLGRPRSVWREFGASQCNMTLLSSTFKSVWSVCSMRKKFRGKMVDALRDGTLHGTRNAGARKQFIGSRSQDFHARPVVGLCALRRVRAFGGCGGGLGCHAIAAQDAVRSSTQQTNVVVHRYGGFINSAAAKRFCGCTRIAPPRGLSRSAIRKNASEITIGSTNRNNSPLRRSP